MSLAKSTAARISKKYRKNVARVHTPQVNPAAVQRRTKRAQNLYKRFTAARIKKIWWQDEKLFTIQLKKDKR